MHKHFNLLILLLLVCSGCGRELPPEQAKSANFISNNQILVLNEGNFQRGNASIGIYQSSIKLLSNNVFEQVNGLPLGDVLQSAALINGDLWLVLNGSGKITVLDTSNFKIKHTISNLGSPRYLAQNGSEVWVTELYANEIKVIDAQQFSLKYKKPLNGWTEDIVSFNGGMYVLNKDSGAVYYFANPQSTGQKLNPLGTAKKIIENEIGHFIVYQNKDAILVCNLDNTVKERIILGANDRLQNISFDHKTNTWVLVIDNSIYVYQNKSLNKILDLGKEQVYGIACIDKEIYIANAKDFSQQSEMIRIDMNGSIIDRQQTGSISNGFLFLP